MSNITTVTICDTCRHADGERVIDGQSAGELLAEQVEQAAPRYDNVRVRRFSCLMGCEHPCNIGIQGEGKVSYVLGRFAPDNDSAEAILDYAAKHAQSESGVVPFKQWPQGVKGHFISRTPPVAQ